MSILFDEAKHPRGRGGKWVQHLGRMVDLHGSIQGHNPGVQERLSKGTLHSGDVHRIIEKHEGAFGKDAAKKDELVKLAHEAREHMRKTGKTQIRATDDDSPKPDPNAEARARSMATQDLINTRKSPGGEGETSQQRFDRIMVERRARSVATQQHIGGSTGGGGGMLGQPHTHQQPDEELARRHAVADAPSSEAMMNAVSQAHYELRSKNHEGMGHVPMRDVKDPDERHLRNAINRWHNLSPDERRKAHEVAKKHLGGGEHVDASRVPKKVRDEGKRLGMDDAQIAADHRRYGKIAGWRK